MQQTSRIKYDSGELHSFRLDIIQAKKGVIIRLEMRENNESSMKIKKDHANLVQKLWILAWSEQRNPKFPRFGECGSQTGKIQFKKDFYFICIFHMQCHMIFRYC